MAYDLTAKPQYATAQQLKDYPGAGLGNNPVADAVLNQLLLDASRMLDRETGTWWDARTVKLTYTASPESEYIWLPAPVISLTSTKEGGTTLTEITSPTGSGDFYVRHDLRALQKSSASLWPGDRYRRRRGSWWSAIPNGIEVNGSLGWATNTAPGIVTLTCALAAAIGEYRRRTYVDADGAFAEVPVSALPGWLKGEIGRMRWRPIGGHRPRVEYP